MLSEQDQRTAGWAFPHQPAGIPRDYFVATGTAIVMLLITLPTPLMSVISLVTRLFSAAFLATPLTVTTPSVVSTLVFKALVDRCENKEDLTWAVMEASSIFSLVDSPGLAGVLATVI